MEPVSVVCLFLQGLHCCSAPTSTMMASKVFHHDVKKLLRQEYTLSVTSNMNTETMTNSSILYTKSESFLRIPNVTSCHTHVRNLAYTALHITYCLREYEKEDVHEKKNCCTDVDDPTVHELAQTSTKPAMTSFRFRPASSSTFTGLIFKRSLTEVHRFHTGAHQQIPLGGWWQGTDC